MLSCSLVSCRRWMLPPTCARWVDTFSIDVVNVLIVLVTVKPEAITEVMSVSFRSLAFSVQVLPSLSLVTAKPEPSNKLTPLNSLVPKSLM